MSIKNFFKNKFVLGVVAGVGGILVLGGIIFMAVKLSHNIQSESRDEAVVEVTQELPQDDIYEYGISIAEYDTEEGSIRNGEFFSTLMTRLGVSQNQIYNITNKAKGIFDMRQIKVGNMYHAFFTKDEAHSLAYLVYEKDKLSYVLFSVKDSLYVQVHERDVQTVIDYVEVKINTSLWEDVDKSDAPLLLALKLADIYAWSIDFFGLQKGDSFKAVYEKVMCDGKVLTVENVLYSEFIHQNKSYEVFYYDAGDKGNLYWNEKGESMRKAFLKAPLSFTRISSGFSYARKHPVTRKVSPHTGVDYAAPMGTEVMSIGDGVVVFKGKKGNEGNMVKIKHNSTYTSAYLHLSRFGKNVAMGQRVRQGEIIGYVGSTGRSTGPHLDFRIWKNGSPINPLKMQSPPAVPISSKEMPNFEKQKLSAINLKDRFLARNQLGIMVERLHPDSEGEQ